MVLTFSGVSYAWDTEAERKAYETGVREGLISSIGLIEGRENLPKGHFGLIPVTEKDEVSYAVGRKMGEGEFKKEKDPSQEKQEQYLLEEKMKEFPPVDF